MTSLPHGLWLVALSCLFASGCTTSRVVRHPQTSAIATLVKPGDVIDCTLRDGTDWKFKVVRVEPDALVGPSQRVKVQDLTYLKVRRFSLGKTLLLVAGVAIAGFGAEGVAELGALGFPATVPP